MASEQAPRDDNHVPSLLLASSSAPTSETKRVVAGANGGVPIEGSQVDGTTNAQNPLLMGAEAQDPTSLPAATTAGKIVRLLTNLSRALIVYLGYNIEGENATVHRMSTIEDYNYTNITTASTTNVRAGAGKLRGIVINKAIAGSTITIYDNTAGSGTKIGTITFGAALLSDPPIFADFSVSFSIGCTIVTSAAVDITVETL